GGVGDRVVVGRLRSARCPRSAPPANDVYSEQCQSNIETGVKRGERSLYFSIVTATTLGYGDVSPSGWLRVCAVLEVIGGMVLAGLAVSAIVGLPSQQTRRATKACTGWWCERVVLPRGRCFYSFGKMFRDADTLRKNGHNHDPDQEQDESMHLTWFNGQVITSYFPTMLSIYENDPNSPAYTRGVYRFDMAKSIKRKYLQYTGFCYDSEHGCRDSIEGRKITDKAFIKKAEAGTLTDEDRDNIIKKLFPGAPDSQLTPPVVQPIAQAIVTHKPSDDSPR
ncbi:MAG: potassium channel family protein, partial [Phycisphaerales bacterium]|nr:potassium channel family protein [Phycisphaerales bacterium]